MLVLEGVLTGGYRCLKVCVDTFLERALANLSPKSLAVGRDFLVEDAGFVHEGHVFDLFDVVPEVGHVPALLAECL